ncbi:MAG: PorT family protein [Bacteroidales bacterium]|nr:PorT family protein [Bacteroidales bacterium]
MKQVIIPLFLFLFGCLQPSFSQAQETSVKLGLKVSPNIAWMSPETKHYSYDGISGGATVGLVSDFYFAKNYAFSTGFNFSFLNGKASYGDSLLIDTTATYGQLNRKYKFIYLDIPYMIKLQTNTFGRFSFFGQIGFTTGFRISAKARDEIDPQTGASPFKENSNITSQTTLIRQSVIFGGGLEYHLDINTRIFFGVNYSNSLNNILTGHNTATDLNEKSQLNFIELNLGVLF